jgi:uncharacterized Tic20 family protein
MTVMDNGYRRRPTFRHPRWGGRVPSRTEELLSSYGYLGAIVTGPILPLAVYLSRRRVSPFVRWHAAQALNVALTFLVYLVCGAIVGFLLSLDSARAALIIMVPVAVLGWVIMVRQLVSGAAAASAGDFREIPGWICSPFVR